MKPPIRHRLKFAFSIARLRVVLGAYSAKQLAHARVIAETVHARGLPERVLAICLETGMTESALLVYANGNNPESLRLPHDAVGWDHASVGIFQQQVPMWGTTADCMDPAKSCGKFLNRLVQHDWQAMSNWQAAQAVQVSAFADGSNYRANDARARALAAQLWAEINRPPIVPIKEKQSMVYAVIGPDFTGHNTFLLAGGKVLWVSTNNDAASIMAAIGQTAIAKVSEATHNKWVQGQ